jgi:hypothetical protein
MNEKQFRAQIKDGLKHIDNGRNIVRFAGLCALRSLPFLGARGHFGYWAADEKQKHLYAVFYAIDMHLSYVYAPVLSPLAAAETYASVFIPIAKDAYTSAGAASAAARDAAAASVASAASLAVIAAYDDAFAFAFDSCILPPRAAISAATAATAAFATFNAATTDLYQRLLLQDLANIGHDLPVTSTSAESYGPAWRNFCTALQNEGCAYWARMYERLFEKGFVPGTEELKELALRITLPGAICRQGARAVAFEMSRTSIGGRYRLN